MEYDKSKCSQRRALSVLNANYSNINQSKADLNYPSVSDGKKLFYQNVSKNHAVNDGTKGGSDASYEAQKENIIDLSRVKKEPRANIHKLERDVEQKRPLTSESTCNEEFNMKTQKSLDTSGYSVASEDTDREPLIESMDSKMHWDEDSGELPPSLTDLIFKPKPNKISRPPNAFMLFAKEHRRQVGIDHPAETNRQISTLLGNMWRDLSSEEKIKYYKEAQALEKLHKETYPSYVYSPSEARMRKQTRTERKMKMRDTPLSSKCSRTTIFDDNRNVSPNNETQERNFEGNGENSNHTNETNKPLSEKYLNFPLNSFYTPLYFPHPYRGWPTIGNRMPSRNVCMPQCSCPNHGPSTSQSSSTYKAESHCSPTSFNNPRPFFPIPNHLFPFPPRAMLHPAFWNPWFLWPGAFCFPPTTPNIEELQKNWMRFLQLHYQELEKLRTNSTMEGKTDSVPQQTPLRVSDDDGDFQPLVIDDERLSEEEQRKS